MTRTTSAALAAAWLALVVLAAGCGGGAGEPEPAPTAGAAEEKAVDEPTAEMRQRGQELAQELLIVDTHVDVPYRLVDKPADISRRTEDGDFDYERARAGGLDAPFMSIYVPAKFQADREGGAREKGDELIDMVEGFARDWPDKFALARSPAEVREVAAAEKIALPMGMENGAPVEDDLANLRHFYDRGIRYITLTHSENNQICDSSYAKEERWDGLSPFGREVVAEMNRLGIMVDVSHVSDDAFWQVMEVSRAPAIASHSSARRFTPGWQRNMSDEMIRALAEHGGVIQINFGSGFLTDEARQWWEAADALRKPWLEENGYEAGGAESDEWMKRHRADNPYPFAGLDDVVDHVDHVVEIAGVDHVGFGSDFDGVGDSLPTGLKSVADYPNLIAALLARGYSEEEIAKIAGGNLMRVWEEVERVAAEAAAQTAQKAAPTGAAAPAH